MKREDEEDPVLQEEKEEDECMSVDGVESDGSDGGRIDEDSEDSDNEDPLTNSFSDVGAEFRADVRNALGDLAAVDSDQVQPHPTQQPTT